MDKPIFQRINPDYQWFWPTTTGYAILPLKEIKQMNSFNWSTTMAKKHPSQCQQLTFPDINPLPCSFMRFLDSWTVFPGAAAEVWPQCRDKSRNVWADSSWPEFWLRKASILASYKEESLGIDRRSWRNIQALLSRLRQTKQWRWSGQRQLLHQQQ